MDIPFEKFRQLIQCGDIYFFEVNCPYGIPNHPHILIKHNDKFVFLCTCSSQIDTSIRLALARQWNNRTYPIIKSDEENRLSKEFSYVDCNNVYVIDGADFMTALSSNLIHINKGGGRISDKDLQKIWEGLKLSTNLSLSMKRDIFDDYLNDDL